MRFLLIVGTIILCSPTHAAELDKPVIDAIVTTALAKWQVPGAIIAVVQGDREFVSGYGHKKIGGTDAPTADTLFPLASCTKAITTTLLASLVDEGKLRWDDPVRNHEPSFRVADPNVDALITIRDLLSHRSGVRGHDLLWYHAPWDRDEILRRIPKLPVDRPFRGSYEYSTLMVMVAGRIAENRGGKPWAELVRERIAKPLGMDRVAFSTADAKFRDADKATGHRLGKDGRVAPVAVYETPEPNAAGSIHLSARDLVPWLRFQLGDSTYKQHRLVSAAALEETKRPLNPLPTGDSFRRLNPDTVQMSYAMGWLVYDYRGHHVVAHGGMIDGFRVQVTLFPKDDLGIAVINNLHDTKMNQAITNNLADRAFDVTAKDWNAILLNAVAKDAEEAADLKKAALAARRADVPPSVALSEFVGKYVEPAYGDAEIRLEKGKLVWCWSSFVVELDHWEGDTFRMTGGLLEDRLLPFRVRNQKPDAFQFEGQVFEKK